MSTQPAPFREIAILGPGLLGASLALALAESSSIRLWGRRPESIAEVRNFAPVCTIDLAEAVKGADLVIFCTPIEVMGGIARQIVPFLGEETLVTDVGSVKAGIVMELESICGPKRFLGSHPMAGSEQSGSAAARADLFIGAACIVTPTEKTPTANVEHIAQFWKNLECEVHCLSPETHDRQIAQISHLPHLLAGCLVNAVADPAAFQLAGQGFRDSTRIASGPPDMWRGILQSNRTQLLAALAALQSQIGLAEQLLQADDAAGLRNFLAAAKTKRDGITRKVRYGGN
ncbi:MAG: prephenate dehydrogenase/arogenate dehydrogenase family protein [Chthoniobacterales bacterium]